MPESKTIVVSIISPGVSKGAGGFVIINGKLRRIPPNSPKLKGVDAAINLMAQEESIADKKMRSQLAELSESLMLSSVNGLVVEVGEQM